MKVVQIKGSNGSGKTTIVKDLMSFSSDVEYLLDDNSKCYATAFHDLGWAALGKYSPDKVMGGVDSSFSTIDCIKLGIQICVNYANDNNFYGVVFEGMMISTIKSTFYDYLLGMENSHDIEPVFVILETTPSGCLRRIEGRGTKKPGLKFENLVGKCTGVLRHAITYNQKYVRWMDVEALEQDDMLPMFLKLVGDNELLDAVLLTR